MARRAPGCAARDPGRTKQSRARAAPSADPDYEVELLTVEHPRCAGCRCGAPSYSVPYQLIGKLVEVRETKDLVYVFTKSREVAVHDKAIATAKQRRTLAARASPREGAG